LVVSSDPYNCLSVLSITPAMYVVHSVVNPPFYSLIVVLLQAKCQWFLTFLGCLFD
jgi:hypothetical protein